MANTENTVEITKRDLSAAGTKISVNTASGYVPVTATSASLSKYLTFTGVEGTDIELAYDKDYVVYISDGKVTLDPKKELTNGKEYTVTVEAKDGGNCKNKQDFKVIATSATLESVTHEHEYTTPYTGEAIQPSKTDLGKLYINYIGDDGQTKNELLDPDAYEITGYTNNTDASGLDSKGKDYVKKHMQILRLQAEHTKIRQQLFLSLLNH